MSYSIIQEEKNSILQFSNKLEELSINEFDSEDNNNDDNNTEEPRRTRRKTIPINRLHIYPNKKTYD